MLPLYRIVFMGTPDFAVPSLETLAKMPAVDLAGVVTQPDRPSGRGRHLTPPPVKTAAERLGLPIMQVATLRDPDARQRLAAWAPDAFVVAAFGLILGRRTLAIPRIAAINVHASLLPAYRGASPIVAAIASGERETGVTLMRMEPGLDTGPLYVQQTTPVIHDDTTESLTARLALIAAELLDAHLPSILADGITPVPQSGHATLTRPLAKADGWLDWSRPVEELARRVRAMNPWPRAWTTLPDGASLQIHMAVAVPMDPAAAPGTVQVDDNRLLVACGDGLLKIVTAQAAGGRPVRGIDLVRGRKIAAGTRLGVAGSPEAMHPLVTPVPD